MKLRLSAGLVLALALVLFPGQRLGLALTLATGIGRDALQRRIDALESKAIAHAPFNAEDREFLGDFYRTLATGGRLSLLVAQTGRMMDHYLDGSGAPYRLEPRIFRDNSKVRAQLALLRKGLGGRSGCEKPVRARSATFYMPDASQLDSVFGLYHGHVELTRARGSNGGCIWQVRAEVPWQWPSYASLLDKHGSYHAESFPLPNLQSLLWGRDRCLFVDNGLGQYLVELGLARPFLAFAEWEE
jgi:hypothetical protein